MINMDKVEFFCDQEEIEKCPFASEAEDGPCHYLKNEMCCNADAVTMALDTFKQFVFELNMTKKILTRILKDPKAVKNDEDE